ncbi:MAG: hypothetical protein QOI38_2294 [Sphingomonadales bacterium]|jgi:hypothetical protein|nr:hypothetical protein [Sphingomonadales bacterium]
MDQASLEPVPWQKISKELADRHEALRPLLGSLSALGGETVFELSVPYGTRLIEGGRFCWSLLDGEPDVAAGYGDTPIPLGVVLDGSIELFEKLSSPQEHRTVPMYLITPGDFFGLFENFAPGLEQLALTGSAGGTTLVVCPRMGKAGAMNKFAKGAGWSCPNSLRETVKTKDKSPLAFGDFFAQLLRARGIEWRVRLAIFPQSFVALLDTGDAALAMARLALSQMTIALERAQRTAAMLHGSNRGDQGDVVAVRQIGRGIRPGFVPVLGTDADEIVLPSRALHELLYEPTWGLFSKWRADQADQEAAGTVAADADEEEPHPFFPSIFRPALPDESPYYLLRRPYAAQRDTNNSAQRLTNLIHDVRQAEPGWVVESVSRDDLERQLKVIQPADPVNPSPSIRLGPTYFLDGGIVRIQTPIRRGNA